MDVAFINPFIVSSRQVFDLMIHLPLELEKPYVRTHGNPNYTVSAIIGFGGAVSGCIVLGFTQQVALALASGMMETPLQVLDADCVDALGEIVNMIAGSAKKDLPGGLSTVSTPSVILGSHSIKYPTGVPIIVIPCQTQVGVFTIEVAIQKNPTAQTRENSPSKPAIAVSMVDAEIPPQRAEAAL